MAALGMALGQHAHASATSPAPAGGQQDPREPRMEREALHGRRPSR